MSSEEPLKYDEFEEHEKSIRSIPKYDSSKEKKLPHTYWTIDHQSLDAGLRGLSESTLAEIRGVPCDDIELLHVMETGRNLHKIQPRKKFKIVVCGPQAAGKSTFMCSLLDCLGLCRYGATGQACTNVPIRYIYYRGNSGDAFLAEVTFLKAEKIRELIEEQSRAYYHFYHFDDETEEMAAQGLVQNKSREHDDEDIKEKDTAVDIFETLFGGRTEFNDAWSAERYRSGAFQRECERKCEEAIGKLDTTTDKETQIKTVRYYSSNSIDLNKKIQQFTMKMKGAASLCPFVDFIDIGLDRSLLKHLDIWDLPGWGDINLAKTRHADEIKDDADVEIILADTNRIVDNAMFIANIKAAYQNRDAKGVMIIATKIDIFSEAELSSAEGDVFTVVTELLHWVEEKIEGNDDNEDQRGLRMLDKYKVYLERKRKCAMILERSRDIDPQLHNKFQDQIGNEDIQIFHVASTDYLTWIAQDTIKFSKQPSLTAELTGIPKIRSSLHDLTVEGNLAALRNQAFNEVNAYIGKIERATSNDNRNPGFKTIASKVDAVRKRFIAELEIGATDTFAKDRKAHKKSSNYDMKQCRDKIQKRIENQWFKIAYRTFNKIVKQKGLILPATSKAKGLEGGCDWNKELSLHFEDLFKKWKSRKANTIGCLLKCLTEYFLKFHDRVCCIIKHLDSDISAIEIARSKWIPLKPQVLVELDVFTSKLKKQTTHSYRRVTMADGRQNGLMPEITDSLFNSVYNAVPALKSSTTEKRNVYVEPKYAFQKKNMIDVFLNPNNHIVNKVQDKFMALEEVQEHDIINSMVTKIDNILQSYIQTLLDQAPPQYEMTERGENIRTTLRGKLPEFRSQALALQSLIPPEVIVRDEDDNAATQFRFNENSHPSEDRLIDFIERMSGLNSDTAANPFKATLAVKRERSPYEDEDSLFVSDSTMKKRRL